MHASNKYIPIMQMSNKLIVPGHLFQGIIVISNDCFEYGSIIIYFLYRPNVLAKRLMELHRESLYKQQGKNDCQYASLS